MMRKSKTTGYRLHGYQLLIGCTSLAFLLSSWTLPAEGKYIVEMQRCRPFNSHWLFLRDSIQDEEKPTYDDSHWTSVDLPHDFSMMKLKGNDRDGHIGAFSKYSPGCNNTGHVIGGTGWYRKAFTMDRKDRGKRFFLDFDGAYMETDVWVNGQKMGEHKNGYTPFCIDITPAIRKAGDRNLVAVRVKNIGKNSRWYSGSGLYRNVNLLVTNPVHVSPWGAYITTPSVDTKEASVKVQLTLKNERSQAVSPSVEIVLIDPVGKTVGKMEQRVSLAADAEQTIHTELNIHEPSLWSVDTPAMYQARIRLKSGTTVLDEYWQPFGIRDIKFTADRGFLLNGKPLLLKGGCVHHDNGLLGAAAIDRAEYRRVELLKSYGYNAIRCAHNPPSTAFLNACDELGMLVIDEFSDLWNLYKNPDDYARFFEQYWKTDLADMLKRDRNHPSVIAWSIGNEIPKMSIAEGTKIATRIRNEVKAMDSTRAVTEAVPSFLIHGGWNNTKDYFSVLDICGYNYMPQKYESDHEQYPNRIMYASESYPNQAYDYWKAVEKHPYVIGDFVWTAMDYLGEVTLASATYAKEINSHNLQTRDGLKEGTNPTKLFDMMAKYSSSKWPSYLSWCGDIDITGEKKPQSLYRDVLWDKSVIEMNVHGPVPEGLVEDISLWGWPQELPSWTWNGQEGQLMKVRVFTKATEVKLQLNGKNIGDKTLTEADRLTATFDVPYQSGTLTAIALENGKEIGRKVLATTGKPQAIRLQADRQTIKADPNDLAFIKIEMVDGQGNLIMNDSSVIEISVTGDGEMAASGNADYNGIKSVNNTNMNLFRGRAQVIVRPNDREGKITIHVKANRKYAASTVINVEK